MKRSNAGVAGAAYRRTPYPAGCCRTFLRWATFSAWTCYTKDGVAGGSDGRTYWRARAHGAAFRLPLPARCRYFAERRTAGWTDAQRAPRTLLASEFS